MNLTADQRSFIEEVRRRNAYRLEKRVDNLASSLIGNPSERSRRRETAIDDVQALLEILDHVTERSS